MGDYEFLGRAVEAIVLIIGLIFTVSRPLMKNTEQMSNLSLQFKMHSELYDEHVKEFKDQIKKNSEKHEELWKHNHEQDAKIQDHETRIYLLEKLDKKGGD